MDVYVSGDKLYGMNIAVYQVWVDGSVYAELTAQWPLTFSEMNDIADGYREGLTNGD